VFSRIVGYYRPVGNWNAGKQEEFRDRLVFAEKKALEKPLKCAAS
jgi:ribonucleoside-triphosphate reductase